MPKSKKDVSKSAKTAVKEPTKTPLPNWPSFEPKASIEDLSPHELCPGQIVTIAGFWTASLCKKYVKFLSSLPLVTTPGKPKKGEAVRVNDRFQVDDPWFAERLWSETGLKDLVLAQPKVDGDADAGDAAMRTAFKDVQSRWGGTPVGLNPNIRIYRYSKGQYFDQHYDDSNNLIHPGPPSQPSRTTWTLLLYLTSPRDECSGGETVFYPDSKKGQPTAEPIIVGLETGMALLHKHGKDCMLHEGKEVVEGEKWVIRSDLCVSR